MAYEGKALTYLQINDLDNAWNYATKYFEILNNSDFGSGFLGYLSALRGDHKNVQQNLVGLKKRAENNSEQDLSIDFAFIYSGIGDFDSAFQYLNEAVDKKLGAIVFIDTFVPLHPLSKDPRFQLLRDRIGLPTVNVAAA